MTPEEFNNNLFYFNRALHFNITPNVKSILISSKSKQIAVLRILFEKEPSEEDKHVTSTIAGLIYGDAIYKEVKVEFKTEGFFEESAKEDWYTLFAKYDNWYTEGF